MTTTTTLLACAASLLSALALYAGSRHCRWPRMRRLGPAARVVGVLLAVLALLLWCMGLGIAAGLSVMLATWMPVAMLLPYLAAWTSRETSREPGGRD